MESPVFAMLFQKFRHTFRRFFIRFKQIRPQRVRAFPNGACAPARNPHIRRGRHPNRPRHRRRQAEAIPVSLVRFARTALPFGYKKIIQPFGWMMVEEGGFEPPKSVTTDLQSAPFGRSGTPPYELGAGGRIRTPDLLITNQLLYRLSYTSKYISNSRIYDTKQTLICQQLFSYF